MKKIILLLLIAASCLNSSAQQRDCDSASMERTSGTKQLLSYLESVYRLLQMQIPGMEEVNIWHYDRIPWIGGNVEGTPDLRASKIEELGRSLVAEVDHYSRNESVLTFTGHLAIDKSFRVSKFGDHQSYLIPVEFYGSRDSSTMIISEPIFGMRMLLTVDAHSTDGKRAVFVMPSESSWGSCLLKADPEGVSLLKIARSLRVELCRNEENRRLMDVIISSYYTRSNELQTGTITLTMLPADAYKYEQVTVPLQKEMLGKRFTMDGANFTLEDFAPDDAMISADTPDVDKIRSWRYIMVHDGAYVKDKRTVPNIVRDRAIALGVHAVPASFVQWLKLNRLWDDLVAECSRQEIEAMWRAPQKEEAEQYHMAVGEWLGSLVIDSLGDKGLTEEFKERLIADYPESCNLFEKLGGHVSRYDDPSDARIIAMSYSPLNLEPDFDAIFRGVEKYLADPEAYDPEQQFCYEFEQKYQKPPIDKADLDYLFSVLPEPEREISPTLVGLWYKTAGENDAIIFYTRPKHIDLDSKYFEIAVPIDSNAEEQPD